MTSPVAQLSWRFIRVWQRDLTVYKKIWKISLLPPLLDPLLYLTVFFILIYKGSRHFHDSSTGI